MILNPEAEAVWPDPTVDDSPKVTSVVGPYPAEQTEGTEVNPALNKPSFDGPDCSLAPTVARAVASQSARRYLAGVDRLTPSRPQRFAARSAPPVATSPA